MKLPQLQAKLAKMPVNVREKAMIVISEKSVAYFKQSFTRKSWNGQSWPAAKRPPKRGSLMVRSSKLMNSIRPVMVTASRVRIRAGSPQVPYARIHNEGGVINHPGGTPYFMRGDKAIFVSKAKAARVNAIFHHPLPVTRRHRIPMPQRQFMGYTPELGRNITKSLSAAQLLN